MAITVDFYNFTKRFNSTAQPSGTAGASYSCTIKEGSGVMRPTIKLNASSPISFNYCHIGHFNRYYYVREWYYEPGFWYANLECDVLASYKAAIGGSSLYILRAAGAYNGDIVDNLYPCKAGADFVQEAITSPFLAVGTYIIGVVASDGDYGSIKYYALNAAEIRTLCAYLLNDIVTVANNFSLNDASLALQNSLVDPIQYIKSCTWIPYSRSDMVTTITSNVKVFNWDITGLTGYVLNGNRVRKTFSVPITKHPDTLTRGNYVNSSPYTLLTLSFPPFGVIDIDTSVTCNASTLNLTLDVDLISGRGMLTIQANGVVLNKIEAQIGVPVQLSQVSSDYLGAITNIVSGGASAIASVAKGDISGFISGGASAIGNAVNSLIPRAQTIGSGGGFAQLTGVFQLDHQFFRPVDDDLTQNGRPLCEVRQISGLSGYMLIQDGDVPINGTKEEAEEIQRLLQGGFYYE